MSGSESDEEEKKDMEDRIKQRKSKVEHNFNVKSSKMASSEHAKSRRSMFKRSNATEMIMSSKCAFYAK
jgi:hypothetical protein